MNEFLLIFRTDYSGISQRTPEQAQLMMQKWMDWMAGIADQDKLAAKGNRLQQSGRVVKNNVVTNGPYMEIKESIGGYTIIRAESYADAVEIAKGCPILLSGGNVEVL